MHVGESRTARRTGSTMVLTLMVLASAGSAQETTAPLPPPRPDTSSTPTETPDVKFGPDGAAPAAKAPDVRQADRDCIERITRLGLRFETRPPLQENDCSVSNPVLVSALPNGVEVSPPSLMTCPLAESLSRWAREVVLTEADRHLQSAPTRLLIGTSYQCRDQRSGAKLSEHAFGNAVDITGFEFAKRDPLAIKSHEEGSPEAAFQTAVQKGACAVFTTVLGPGADDDHDDHLHLDMRERKGDYRICQ